MRRLFNKLFTKKKSLHERFPQYVIGRGSYGKPKVFSWGEGSTLTIGAFCSIAAGVKIYLGGEHRTDWVTTYPFTYFWKEKVGYITGHPKSKGDVIIGNDVWIGTEAMIMSGVTIGDGAVIGARSLVTRNVPPYAIVAGNPAQFIRNRFDEGTITKLQKLQWWTWDERKIEKYLPLMLSQDIKAFLEHAENDVDS